MISQKDILIKLSELKPLLTQDYESTCVYGFVGFQKGITLQKTTNPHF